MRTKPKGDLSTGLRPCPDLQAETGGGLRFWLAGRFWAALAARRHRRAGRALAAAIEARTRAEKYFARATGRGAE